MEFQNWVSINGAPVSPKWQRVESQRINPIPNVRTPSDVLEWLKKNISYVSDAIDYWQSPEETLSLKTGDCEDYAILGRAILIAAGFDSTLIWVLIGNDIIAHQDHAILVVDNTVIDYRSPIVYPLQSLTDFNPIVAYSDNRAVTFGRKL